MGVVQRRSTASLLVTRLAAHFAMGAVLGSVLGFCLIHFNIAQISDIVEHAFNPEEVLAIFMGALILNFAVGATLTGFILIKMEEAKE